MILVTGGSGFCGFEIVKYLLAREEKVRVFDIAPLPSKLNGVEFVWGDIRDPKAVMEACRGVTGIIHTVAKVPISKAGHDFFTVNVDGTRRVLDAAAASGIKKVVHISSSAVQFADRNPVPENAPYRPVGDYARSKMEGEKVCRVYAQQGLAVDIIRPRTVVGAGRLGIFDILFEWISEGGRIFIIGKGNNTIQFLHSEDLASCCYLALRSEGSHDFNVGSAAYAPLKEELGDLIRHAGSASRLVSLPVAPSILALRLLDILRLSPLASWHYLTYHKDFYFDNENAKKILGWVPKYGNKELLREAYDSYLQTKGQAGQEYGTAHRKRLKQGILMLLKKFS